MRPLWLEVASVLFYVHFGSWGASSAGFSQAGCAGRDAASLLKQHTKKGARSVITNHTQTGRQAISEGKSARVGERTSQGGGERCRHKQPVKQSVTQAGHVRERRRGKVHQNRRDLIRFTKTEGI